MVLLEVGEEVGTSSRAADEVSKDRGLEAEAQVHGAIEI